MTDLHKRARELVAAAGDGDGPTAADRDGLRAAVLLRVGAAATAAGSAVTAVAVPAKAAGSVAVADVGAASTAAKASVAALTTLTTKALVVFAVVGAGALGTSAYFATSTPKPRAAQPSVKPAAAPSRATMSPLPRLEVASSARVVDPPAPPPAGARTSPPASPAPVASPRPVVTSNLPSSVPASLDAEAGALGSALAALREGQADKALSLLDDQDSRFLDGALGEERSATRIDALCTLGRMPEAHVIATRFLEQHPRSLLAPRVRASCGVTRTP
jgi:hypothetical protein